MKSMYKYELANAAGVSMRTFSRWLKVHQSELLQLGVQPSHKMVPARAVQWICQEYGIDEDEL